MPAPPILVWHRQDLRLADNPALYEAAQNGPVIPIYILSDDKKNPWPMGGASRWWLHYALEDLAAQYEKLDAKLILRRGDPLAVLRDLAKETGANAICWNRCYEPHAIARDKHIKSTLQQDGFEVESYNAALLFEPWELKTGGGTPYKVYTPFSRACFAKTVPAPAPAPKKLLSAPPARTEPLDSFNLLPTKPDWAGGMRESWEPTIAGAQKRLQHFAKQALGQYQDGRNLPDGDTTSRLSPYLHFGQIGPRQIWHFVQHQRAEHPALDKGAEIFLKEIVWREFSYHLLYHFPQMPTQPLQQQFADFPWRNAPAQLRAWQRGQTGYPIVDAGMRQLWHTGWMHNRVRMIVASFLIKHLLLPWQDGERWFWDTLVDADLASNAASWQWVAGSGADAAPYFRIFNPTLQSEKFDPQGAYIRRYVPGLAKLDAEHIHAPWKAPEADLARAGVKLGQNYPKPLLDHDFARKRALEALASLKKT